MLAQARDDLAAHQEGRVWSVSLSLSYNSQNWVQDASGYNWHFGTNTGFGYGWNLQIGVLRKCALSHGWTSDYFEFRDSSGAVYRLNQNNIGIWSSTESIYVWYGSNPNHSVAVTTGSSTNYSAPTAITTANALTTSVNYDLQLNLTSTQNRMALWLHLVTIQLHAQPRPLAIARN